MGKGWGRPGGSAVKNPPVKAGDTGDVDSIPGLGRSLEEEMRPTPVFLHRKSHGQKSLGGFSPWGCKEWDGTERLSTVEEQMKTISV